jgi:hypothetical protein
MKREQDRLLTEIRQAEEQLAYADVSEAQMDGLIDACLEFATRCDEVYASAPPQLRRQMNQAVFERFFVEDDGSVTGEPAGPFKVLLQPDLLEMESSPVGVTSLGGGAKYHRSSDWSDGMPTWLARRLSGHLPRLRLCEGSKEKQLAEGVGFEPTDPVKSQRFSRPSRSTAPAPRLVRASVTRGPGRRIRGARRARRRGSSPGSRAAPGRSPQCRSACARTRCPSNPPGGSGC